MDPHDSSVPRIPTPLVRGIVALSLLGVFFLIASIINPDKSSASDRTPDHANGPRFTSHLDSDQPETEPVLLGTLLGTIYTVEIHGTDRGVRYTVFDDAGERIVDLGTPADVRRLVPDLDLEALRASQISEAAIDDMPGF